MRLLRTLLACAATFTVAFPVSTSLAQKPTAAPTKSPGDLAYDTYLAVRNAKDAKPGPARNAEIIKAGFEFILAFPAHGRTGTVISSVAGFAGSTMTGNANAPARTAYLTATKFELLGQRKREDLNPDQALALASLDVALSGALAREERSRENVQEFREKIDTLAAMPKADRFLSGHEREFGEFIRTGGRLELAVQFYQKLLEHKDKKVVDMAKLELRLLDARMTPGPLHVHLHRRQGGRLRPAAGQGRPDCVLVAHPRGFQQRPGRSEGTLPQLPQTGTRGDRCGLQQGGRQGQAGRLFEEQEAALAERTMTARNSPVTSPCGSTSAAFPTPCSSARTA
jgi:hypothetical protein